MSNLYQYFATENHQTVKSPAPPEVKGLDDDDATPTAGNSKRRQRSIIVEIGSDADLWVGSELQVTRTDSTISNEEITLDGSSRRSSRGSGSELGADDISSVDIGDLSSNEDLETFNSGSASSSSFGIKYNNYAAKRSPPKKKDQPDMTEVKDLGFYTLGISKQPGDRTHRAYVQLSTDNNNNNNRNHQTAKSGEPSPLMDATETSSETDGHHEGILWRAMNDEHEEQIVKKSEEKFLRTRKARWILLVLLILAIAAVAVAVSVTQTGKNNNSGNESSLTSLSAPQPFKSSSSSTKPTVPTRSPLKAPPPSAPPSSTATAAHPTTSATQPPSPAPTRTATQSPTFSPSRTAITQLPSVYPSTLPSLRATHAPSAATPAPSAATKSPTHTPSTQSPSSSPSSAPIPNGNCSGAYGPLQTNGSVELGKTSTSSVINTISSCGSPIVESGAWYSVMGTGDIFNVSTCNEATNFQAKLAIFTGSCDNLACVDSNYNGYQAATCSDGASTISWMSQRQVLYFIFVYGSNGATGSFGLNIQLTPSSAYASCNSTSTLLPSDGSVTLVNTMGATLDSAGSCGATKAGYGVWFYVNGTGKRITADTCNPGSTLDTAITIFTGYCDTLFCIAGNDNYCGLQSSVSWNSVVGQLYHVLVATISETGTFGLTVTSA